MNDVNILTSALIENLIQTITNILSAQEKLEELDKQKFLLKTSLCNAASKNAANCNKLKTLLAGIQIGTQMMINKAKWVYSFDNLDDLATNLRVNYANSFEDLLDSPTKKKSLDDDRTSNKISSYLNVVTSTIHHNHTRDHCNKTEAAKQQQIHQQAYKNHDESQRINEHCTLKCMTTCVGSTEEITQTPIEPKRVTNEFAEFDIKYPSGKIDIWYPRAKINICSETPQIDLKLPEPLVEYKNFHTNENYQRNDQMASSIYTPSFTQTMKSNLNQPQGVNIQTMSYKPKLVLDSVKTSSFTTKPSLIVQQKPLNNDLKAYANEDQSCLHVTLKHTNSIRHAVNCASKARLIQSENKNNELGDDVNINVQLSPSPPKTPCNEGCSVEIETENFVQTMINSGCESLLQQLLQKYILLEKYYKKNQQENNRNNREKDYNEWLKKLYSVDDYEASRIQTYIETWYLNCLMEKLDINNR